jgi:deazaflavin-dependent oxidoreductase (nitroreductase family)
VPLPRRLAELNKTFTNRLLGPLAEYLPWFGVVHHRGRRSGTAYTTPVNVFVEGDRYVIALTYGPDTDWLRNVTAAGGCWLGHRGRLVRLIDPRRLATGAGMAAMPAPVRAILRVIQVTEFVELHR